MSESERTIEAILPTITAATTLLALSHPISAVAAGMLTLPLQYLTITSTRAESERLQTLLYEICGRVKDLENAKEYFKSIHGEDLLKKAMEAAKAKSGEERIKALARILSHYSYEEAYYFHAIEFLDHISGVSEKEWILLRTAYELLESKDHIGQPNRRPTPVPGILGWKQLHEKFPNIMPEELNAIFIGLQRTGLVWRQQGFMDDDGDSFNFSIQLERLISFTASNIG